MTSYRSCLECNCLGERIMGTDVDEVFAYQTGKVVVIKDRLLGLIKYIFMFIIFCYVFVWQVLYKGSHFQFDQLSGVARLQLQHPTKLCNPMDVDCSSNYSSLKSLPYCSQNASAQYAGKKFECKYYDALDLLTPLDGGYLVPSFIETYDQLESCEPNATNGFKCGKKYEFVDEDGTVQKGPGRAKPKSQLYVADIEEFTLLIDHSFRMDTGSVEYDDYKMQGYWLDCSNMDWSLNSTWMTTEAECEKKPIICLHKDCKKLGMVTDEKRKLLALSDSAQSAPDHEAVALTSLASAYDMNVLNLASHRGALRKGGGRGDTLSLEHDASRGISRDEKDAEIDADEELAKKGGSPDVYSLPSGDVLSIRTLFAMAGRSMDYSWLDESKGGNVTTRQRGTVIVVNIHYNNLAPWTLFRPMDPPEYVISVTSRPVDKYKNMKPKDGEGKDRELTVSYGTLVLVQSTGTIGVFKMIHMLIVLSTSLGMLAIASVVTDILALYVLPMKDEYSKAKFQETADIHDLFAKREAEAEAGMAPA